MMPIDKSYTAYCEWSVQKHASICDLFSAGDLWGFFNSITAVKMMA